MPTINIPNAQGIPNQPMVDVSQDDPNSAYSQLRQALINKQLDISPENEKVPLNGPLAWYMPQISHGQSATPSYQSSEALQKYLAQR